MKGYIVLEYSTDYALIDGQRRVALHSMLEEFPPGSIGSFPVSNKPLGPIGFLRVWWAIRKVRKSL